MERYNAIVVGAGLTGGVIARQLVERQGAKVLMVEKRKHIAGNMFDKPLENGVNVQMYGPHTFFTDEEWVVQFIQKYAQWKPFDVYAKVEIDGREYTLPFGFSFIREYYGAEKGEALIKKLQAAFPNQERIPIYDLLEQPDQDIANFACMLCEKDYYPYSAKQWGLPMEKMDRSVISRVKFALSDDTRYIQQKYQYTPREGFTAFFEKMLASEHIDVVLNTDALQYIHMDDATGQVVMGWEGETYQCPIIFTGPIDELFANRYGPLPYRSLDITFRSFDEDAHQSAAFISYPQAEGYTRITEYKKLTGQEVKGKTTVSIEYPQEYVAGVNQPYYPVINTPNLELYQKYKRLAECYKNLFVCGRLGDYKYYNMDAAIIRAFEVESEIEQYMQQYGRD